MDEYGKIREVMSRCGVTSSLEEFQSAVNVTFHKYESEVYDEIHRDMWESLPAQFQLLTRDALQEGAPASGSLNVLDIGCGTGLASDSLMKTEWGKRITSIDLVDTSREMLRKAAERAKSWGVPVRTFEGLLEPTKLVKNYDVIVTCSVLHHIPDLAGFLASVRRLQTKGDVFLHLQDPNGDYLNDPQLKARMKELENASPQQPKSRFHPRRILGRLYRELTGKQRNDYIAKTNRELLKNGVIRRPLKVAELFSVTDIHVFDDRGISVAELRQYLADYELIAQRSYGFYGQLASTLPGGFRKDEERLLAEHALNGFHVGAVWLLRS